MHWPYWTVHFMRSWRSRMMRTDVLHLALKKPAVFICIGTYLAELHHYKINRFSCVNWSMDYETAEIRRRLKQFRVTNKISKYLICARGSHIITERRTIYHCIWASVGLEWIRALTLLVPMKARIVNSTTKPDGVWSPKALQLLRTVSHNFQRFDL